MTLTQDAETLQRCLKKICGVCDVQDGNPCNTCFHNLDLGLNNDVVHLLWIVHLCLRGNKDYTEELVLKANIDNFKGIIKRYGK